MQSQPELGRGETPELTSVPGLKLPKVKATWDEANAYFLAYPPITSAIDNLDECASQFQSSVYNYFQNEYGTYEKPRSTTTSSAKHSLKARLRRLKADNAPIEEIRAVSAALRRSMPTGNKKKTLQ